MRQKPGFYRQVAVLATPIILQNLITSALGMADIFMVGLLGETPMAAVTLVNIPTFVIQLFFSAYRAAARSSSASTGARATGTPSTG